jgi:hypothetical protein
MNKKIALIVFLFVIAISLVGLVFLRGSKTEQSAITSKQSQVGENSIFMKGSKSFIDIKTTTYKSSYGYEITYPEKWGTVLAPKETHSYLEDYAIYPVEISYGPSPIINIVVSEKSLSSVFRELNINLADAEKILVNGISGYVYKSPNHPSVNYFFENAGRVYKVVYWYSSEYGIPEKEALDVLGTFKILK